MAPLHETPPSLGPYLIGCGLVAGWITFGSIHRDQHSDSILNVLISLQCWTSFVWEQDRFGMAVPLLAIPIRHPLANMLFQAYVMIFSGLVTFFLMARYTFRDSSYPAVGLVGASSVIALTPSYFRFEYFIDTSYGISLALTLWGLILVEPEGRLRPRLTVAFVLFLMGVAHWINNASGLFLGPLVLLGHGPNASGDLLASSGQSSRFAVSPCSDSVMRLDGSWSRRRDIRRRILAGFPGASGPMPGGVCSK
jgi:hypothetical protein